MKLMVNLNVSILYFLLHVDILHESETKVFTWQIFQHGYQKESTGSFRGGGSSIILLRSLIKLLLLGLCALLTFLVSIHVNVFNGLCYILLYDYDVCMTSIL